jgi:hypothetical protein
MPARLGKGTLEEHKALENWEDNSKKWTDVGYEQKIEALSWFK